MSFRPVERILGNLRDFALAGRALERVPISSDALARRVLRLPTSVGDLGLRLDGVRLHDGDVVFADERLVIAVGVLPDDVLVIRPRTIPEAIAVGHALGNRHVPVQQDGDAAIARYAPALEAVLRELGVAVERRSWVPPQPFGATAPHAH